MCQDWFEVIHLRDSIYLLFGLPCCRRRVLSYKMTICTASQFQWKGRASVNTYCMYYFVLPTFIHAQTASVVFNKIILPVEVSVSHISTRDMRQLKYIKPQKCRGVTFDCCEFYSTGIKLCSQWQNTNAATKKFICK